MVECRVFISWESFRKRSLGLIFQPWFDSKLFLDWILVTCCVWIILPVASIEGTGLYAKICLIDRPGPQLPRKFKYSCTFVLVFLITSRIEWKIWRKINTISNRPPTISFWLLTVDLSVLSIWVLTHRLRILSDLHRDELLALKRASGPQAEAFWVPPV